MKRDLLPKLPCDINAESIVLGCLLMGSEKAGEIFESLTVEDFYDSRHQVIFRAAKELFERGQSTEMPVVSSELIAAGKIESAGGVVFVTTLIDNVARRTPIAHFYTKVRSKNTLRQIMYACEAAKESAMLAHEQSTPAAEVIDAFLEKLAAIGKTAESDDRGETEQESAMSLLFSLEENTSVRVFTGVQKLDEVTGGFRPGELIVLTAETGVGKTFFALQIAQRACQDKRHSLYCSGEMTAEHLMGRVLASDSGVEYIKIRRPELITADDRAALLEAAARRCKTCRTLDGELTLSRIRMAARSMAANKELSCVVVDYDELVDVHGKDEWEQQRILVRALKSLGMELGVPVVMVSQLRKVLNPAEQKRPTLHRLYGSGAKSKHASIVIYVNRKYVQELKGDETEAQIFILKSRDGRIGMIPCRFNVRTFRFEQEHREGE